MKSKLRCSVLAVLILGTSNTVFANNSFSFNINNLDKSYKSNIYNSILANSSEVLLADNGTYNEETTVTGFETYNSVTNNSNLTVEGSLTSDTTFTNNSSATLHNHGFISGVDLVNKGSYENGDSTKTGSSSFSGTMTNDSTITNHGTFTLSGGGTNNNSGTITNEGGNFTSNGKITNNGNITNNSSDGEFNLFGGMDNSGTLTNQSGNMTVTGAFSNTAKDSGKGVVNSGNLTLGSVTNSGNITNKGTLKAGSVNNNGGTITNESGSLTADSLTNSSSGTVTNNQNANLTITGEIQNQTSSTLTNSGELKSQKLTNNGGTITNNNTGNLTIQEEIKNQAGTFNNNGELTSKSVDNSSTFNNTSNMTLSGLLNNAGGTFTNKGSGNIESGSFQNANSATFDNQSFFTSTGTSTNSGTLKNSGTFQTEGFTNETQANVESTGGSFLVNGNATNKGKITNGSTMSFSGTLTTEENSSIENSGSLSVTQKTTNKGTITNKDDGSSFTASGGMDNSGNFTIEKGTATVTGDLDNSGTITNQSTGEGKGLSITGKLKNSANGSKGVTNSGKLSANSVENSGKITNKGTFDVTTSLNNNTGADITNESGTLKSGSLTNSGTVTNNQGANLEVSGAIQNSKNFNNSGTLKGNSLTNNSAFTNKSTGNLTISDAIQNTAGTFNNEGQLSAKSVTNSSAMTNSNVFNVQEGFTNNSSATFNNETGGDIKVSGTTTNSGTLNNNASFTAEKDVTNSSALNNTGTFKSNSKFTNEANAQVKNSGFFSAEQQSENKGTMTNDETGSMTFSHGFTNSGESSSVTNNSTFTVSGEMKNEGNFTNNEESSFVLNGGNLTNSGTFEQKGDITSSGNITNSGTFNLSGDASGFSGSYSQAQGKTSVSKDAKFFSGSASFTGGDLDWAAEGEADNLSMSGENCSLHLLEGSTFTFKGKSSNISDEVIVDIQKKATFKIADGATFNMNDKDIWSGTIDIEENGILNADGVTNSQGGGIKQSNGTSVFKNGSNITINDDSSSITGGTVKLEDKSTLTFGSGLAQGFKSKELDISDDSTFGLLNGGLDLAESEDVKVENQANFTVDLNQRAKKSDQYKFKKIEQKENGTSGELNISDFNMLGDCPVDRVTKFQLFNVEETQLEEGKIQFEALKKLKRTPSGWYGLNPVKGEAGYYTLYLAENVPEEFRNQAAILGLYVNQLQIDDIITNHFILNDQTLIEKAKNANKYSAVSPLFDPYQKTYKDGGIWSKSYASLDRMDLTQNLRVGNNIYGTIVGADLPAIELNNDWTFIPTGYVGYNGAHQYFDGVSSYQNSGQLGVMATFIKNEDFITSMTAYGGGYMNEMTYSTYTDDLANWYAGTAVKTAYNLHPFEDFIIQPNMFVAYNAFGSQDWHSDYGNINMHTNMFNGINAAPGVNFILSKDTWSLYATFQYMYFMNDKVNGSIGNIKLPGVKLDHGVFQYGLGATKTFNDNLATYAQINLHNAGVTGIGFQLGFQWLFDIKLPWAKK